ncbi:MAG: hypothetical protein WEG56_09360 [Chloroflexota bacterium]
MYFSRDAVSGILVAAPLAGDDTELRSYLEREGGEALARADEVNLLRLTPAAARFFYAGGPLTRWGQVAAGKYLEAIGSIEASARTADHLEIMSLIATSSIDSPHLTMARGFAAEAPTEAQAGLFREPAALALTTGPVVEAWVKALAATGPSLSSAIEARETAQGLANFVRSGGELTGDLGALASQWNAVINSLPGEPTPEFFDVFDLVVEILESVDVPELETLRSTLASRPFARAKLISASFRVAKTDAGREQSGRAVGTWIDEAATNPDDITPVLAAYGQAMLEADVDWLARIRARWIATRDLGFADLLAAYGGDEGKDYVLETATSEVDKPTLMSTAIKALADSPGRLQRLRDELAARSATAPLDLVEPLVPGLTALAGLGVNVDIVRDSLTTRAKDAPAGDIDGLIRLANEIGDAGLPWARSIADPLAKRTRALGFVTAKGAEWLASSTSKGQARQDAAEVVANAIRDRGTQPDDALRLAQTVKKDVSQATVVSMALADRISADDVPESIAGDALSELAGWRAQRRADVSEYDRLLSIVAGRYPSLTDLVVAAKKVK